MPRVSFYVPAVMAERSGSSPSHPSLHDRDRGARERHIGDLDGPVSFEPPASSAVDAAEAGRGSKRVESGALVGEPRTVPALKVAPGGRRHRHGESEHQQHGQKSEPGAGYSHPLRWHRSRDEATGRG